MVTIIDVANYAGVSKTTVSAVLNNGPHVKEETRRKGEEAVKALGYVCSHTWRNITSVVCTISKQDYNFALCL